MKLVDKLKTLFKRKQQEWNGKVILNGVEYHDMDEALPKILDTFFAGKKEERGSEAEDKKETDNGKDR